MEDILNGFSGLKAFSQRDRDWLLSVGHTESLVSRDVLIHEGQPLDALYLLVSGNLGVITSSAEGAGSPDDSSGADSTQIIGQVGPGQILGEISLVTNLVPIATVQAIEPCQVLAIPHPPLTQKLQQDPAFAAHFYQVVAQILSQRLRQNTNLLALSQLLPIPPLRKALFMFAIFQDSDLSWILTHGQKRNLEPGTVLIQEGEPVQAVYILLDGVLEVSVQIGEAERSEQKVLASLESGEILGEISFVEQGDASATVTCAQRSLVLAVPQARLAAQLNQEAGFAARFYEAISIVLGDRIRDGLQQRGYGRVAYEQGESLDMDIEYADELDMDTLEQTAIAGSRFDWFLRQVKAKQA